MLEIKESQGPSIGVMTVATNIYFDYWQKMVISADKRSTQTDQITFFVFTEQIQKIDAFSKTLKNVKLLALGSLHMGGQMRHFCGTKYLETIT